MEPVSEIFEEKELSESEKLTKEKADYFERSSEQIKLLVQYISVTVPNSYEKKEIIKKLFQVHKWIERVFDKDWKKDGVTY